VWSARKQNETWLCRSGLILLGTVLIVSAAVAFVRGNTTGLHFIPLDFSTQILPMLCWFVGGTAAGCFLASLQRHPRRILGLVPWGGLGLSVALFCRFAEQSPQPELCGLLGLMSALIAVPLALTCARGASSGRALFRYLGDGVIAVLFAAPFILWMLRDGEKAEVSELLIAGVATVAALASWLLFRREVLELFIEGLFVVMYRFRTAGPGLEKFPLQGPVLVVANHSAWFDPLWLAKVLPRTLVPMMTSLFFDLPVLRWMMVYLADAIRVEESRYRREAPELQAAIAALDTGKCVVIFPEGRMRRTEAKPLKMFGQGVWHILRERPETLVVVCWIEGGWGSFFSYFHGLPTKNKRFDLRRPIAVAVGEPEIIPEEILADLKATRKYLMAKCGETRKYLGLEPVVLALSETEAEEEESPEQAPG
jgi:1-acyl-sn-glycerol-3-phosphate acyltransferase